MPQAAAKKMAAKPKDSLAAARAAGAEEPAVEVTALPDQRSPSESEGAATMTSRASGSGDTAETYSVAACTKMLNWLRYRASSANKRGELQEEAAQALQTYQNLDRDRKRKFVQKWEEAGKGKARSLTFALKYTKRQTDVTAAEEGVDEDGFMGKKIQQQHRHKHRHQHRHQRRGNISSISKLFNRSRAPSGGGPQQHLLHCI
jgi:hypothetical protein